MGVDEIDTGIQKKPLWLCVGVVCAAICVLTSILVVLRHFLF